MNIYDQIKTRLIHECIQINRFVLYKTLWQSKLYADVKSKEIDLYVNIDDQINKLYIGVNYKRNRLIREYIRSNKDSSHTWIYTSKSRFVLYKSLWQNKLYIDVKSNAVDLYAGIYGKTKLTNLIYAIIHEYVRKIEEGIHVAYRIVLYEYVI